MTYLHTESYESNDTTAYTDIFTSGWRLGDYENVTTKQSRSGSKCLHVPLETGDHYGMAALLDTTDAGITDSPPRELYASYWVKFDPNFDFGGHTHANKLPGFENHERRGESEPSDGTNGWAARGMFRNAGGDIMVGYYVYHMDQPGRYGEDFDATTLARGKWHHIEQYVRLNTADGQSAARDGELTMWVNGNREVHDTSMAFTYAPERGVNYAFQVYYGGGDPSPAENRVWIDDWALATDRVGHPGPTLGDPDSDADTGSDSGNGSGAGGSGPDNSTGDEPKTGTDNSETDNSETGDSGSNPATDPDTPITPPGTQLRLQSAIDSRADRYSFTTNGPVTDADGGGANEGSDQITDNGDGTYTAEGVCADGSADTYYVEGEVTAIDINTDIYSVFWGGTRVEPSMLTIGEDGGQGQGQTGNPNNNDNNSDTNGDEPMSYDTITIPAGETRTFNVSSGETFANKLIDMSADGASAKIYANGTDWTVRNVAFKGNHPGGHYLFTPAVSQGGTATVENLYMGDGQTEGSGKGGIWVNGHDHYGTLNFRHVNIQHFIDNGLYGTDPGYSYHGSHGGVVNVADSYFNSNNIANIRVGSIDGRVCTVRNCVVETGSTRGCGVGCTSPGAKNSRGVWAWWGPVEVIDSDIEGSRREQTSRAGNPEIRSTNTRWGADADTTRERIPDGVPMTAEEAASGSAGGSSGGTGDTPSDGSDGVDAPAGTRFDLTSVEGAPVTGYQFTVTGSVTKAIESEPVADGNDGIMDNADGTMTVRGEAGNGYGDGYWVDGTVTGIDVDTAVYKLAWDGTPVTPGDLPFGSDTPADGDGTGDGDTDTDTGSGSGPVEVTFRSPTRADATHDRYGYVLVVDGEVSPEKVEGNDTIAQWDNGRTVIVGGMVAGRYTDVFTIEGDVVHASVSPGLTVEQDGEGAVIDALAGA